MTYRATWREQGGGGPPESNSSLKSNSPSAAAVAEAYRFPEPVLTKNELGPNSSSESESWAGWAALLPSNPPWLSLAAMEGGGYGSCSTGEEEADEQCSGGPVDHKQRQTHGGEMKHTQTLPTSQEHNTHPHTHARLNSDPSKTKRDTSAFVGYPSPAGRDEANKCNEFKTDH